MKKFSVILLILFISVSFKSFAQVSAYPPVMILKMENPSDVMSMRNTSAQFREVTISFEFGYIDFDNMGKATMNYDDSSAAEKYALDPFAKVFPQKLVIPPNTTQAVRILANIPPDKPDGTYWTRIHVKSSPVEEQVDTTSLPDNRRGAKFIIHTEMVNLLLFQKGIVTSDVDVEFSRVYSDSANYYVLFDFDKTGNSPFWGMMYMDILDAEEEVVASSKFKLPLYFSNSTAVPINKDNLNPGRYTARVTINNEVDEISESNRIDFPEMTKTFEIEIPQN